MSRWINVLKKPVAVLLVLSGIPNASGVAFALLNGSTNAVVPAFPGAVGFGAETVGGRGGTVYKVTTLDDYAENETPIEGSLRYAVEQAGPRIVVFAVSGNIHLKRELRFSNPYITIAGNTAPFPGITIVGYMTSVRTDQVILRYLRFRLSVDILRQRFAEGNQSEWDSLQVYRAENVMMDHLSGSHSVDETLSMTETDRATMQHCMAAYSLLGIFHPKWPAAHNFGSLTGYIGAPDHHAAVSSLYNAWINHYRRMPGLSAVEDPNNMPSWIDVRYSLMYNWNSYASGSEASSSEIWRQNYYLNYVGNYLKPGPETPAENRYAGLAVRGALNKLWVADNRHDTDVQNHVPTDQEGLIRYFYDNISSNQFLPEPFPTPYAPAPEISIDGILTDTVGDSIPARDSIDYAAVLDVRNDTGRYARVDMETDDSPPLPDLVSAHHMYSRENDPFPVWWKRLQGLPDDAVIDPSADSNRDGYTDIEAYMYGLNLNGPVVAWADPSTAGNINPLEHLTGEEISGLMPSSTDTGWADRETNETVFSTESGLIVMSSSTANNAETNGVHNILNPDTAFWSSGSTNVYSGPVGAKVDQGDALVLAFPLPRKISDIQIHRTDFSAYPATHDPASVRVQGLKGWPDHWVDLTEKIDLPVFSDEHKMNQLVIPESMRGPYAAYRLVFPGPDGTGDDLRIQYVTFN